MRVATILPGAHRAGAFVVVAMLLEASARAAVQAGSYESGRTEAGARAYFRATLNADTEIEKRVAEDGVLHLAVVYTRDSDRAAVLAELVAKRDASKSPDPIRGIAVRVDIVPLDEIERRPVSALFIAEPLKRPQVEALVRLGIERRILVYSSFEGDVEKGVSGGLSVQAQLLPFINTATLRASQITLREFFVKQAKVYP